jgi:hypothetical protein
MGRVFFPTSNSIGVRTTLSGVSGPNTSRAPAEPGPRAAMNPVNLGAVLMANGGGFFNTYRARPIDVATGLAPAPPVQLPSPVLSTTVADGSAAPAVSAQVSPTPQVSVPPPSARSLIITSGGGTPSPSTGAAAAPSTSVTVSAAPDITSQIAAWLGGSTSLFGYSVPNALLAAAVVLGFAALSSGGKKR